MTDNVGGMALGIDANSLERIASELALRALENQQDVVKELRQRAVGLVAAESLIVAFLGEDALDPSGFDPLAWFTLAALGSAVSAALWLLMSERLFAFVIDGRHLYGRLLTASATTLRSTVASWTGTPISEPGTTAW